MHYQIRICISGHSKFDKRLGFFIFFFLQNCFNIKLLIIMFIRMCDVQYLKKEKLKMLITWDDLSFINTTQKFLKPFKKNGSIPRMDEKKLHTWEFQLKGIGPPTKLFSKPLWMRLYRASNNCYVNLPFRLFSTKKQ